MDEFYVSVGGRKVRVFRRGTNKDVKKRTWYVRLTAGGVNRNLSLKTCVKEVAAKNARLRCDKIFTDAFAADHGLGSVVTKKEMSSDSCRAGAVYDIYLAERRELGMVHPRLSIERSSVLKNAACFKELIEVAFPGKNWRMVRIRDLYDDGVVIRWRRVCYQRVGKVYGNDVDLGLNVTLNSKLAQGRSVCARSCVKLWEVNGLVVSEKIFPGYLLLAKRARFRPLEQGVDKAMMQAAGSPDHDDWPGAETAVIYELARFCGLTLKEIMALQWHWFDFSHERCFIDIELRDDFKTKWDTKNRRIEVKLERVKKWKGWLGLRDPVVGRLIRPGSQNRIYRAANNWVAGYLPGRKKRLHELRKQRGSEVYHQTKSVVLAARYLGDSVQTALKHYVEVLEEVGAA